MRGNQEWTIQRKPKRQSRMDNPEKTKEAIKNRQSRENQRGNQEWTIQRKPKGQSRMDNPETLGNKTKNKDKQNITQKTKKMSKHGPHQNCG